MHRPESESTSECRNVRVAAVQMVSTPRLDENLRAAEALIAQAETIKAELAKGANLGRFGIVDVSPEIAREGRIEGTPDTLLATAFSLEKGAVQLIEAPGYVGLVQVDDILPADQASEDAKALKAAIAAQVDQGMAQDAYALFAAGLATQAGISFDQTAIEAVHAQLR